MPVFAPSRGHIHLTLCPRACPDGSESLASVVAVRSLSHVRLSVTPWPAARQASPSLSDSGSLPTIVSIESTPQYCLLKWELFWPRPGHRAESPDMFHDRTWGNQNTRSLGTSCDGVGDTRVFQGQSVLESPEAE